MTKKHILIVLKIVVSVGLIYFLFSDIDLGAERDRIMSADIGLALVALAMMYVQMALAGARWWATLRAFEKPLPLIEMTRLFYIGVFFSQALPSSVGGDPIRIYMAYKGGLPLSKSINSVMLERGVAIIGLVLLVAVLFPIIADKLTAEIQTLALSALGLLATGIVCGLVFIMFLDRVPARFQHFRLVMALAHLASDTRRLFLSPANALHVIFWGVVAHANMALCVYFLAAALDLPVTWIDCMVLTPPVLLMTTLPISIGGWGVREYAMQWAFGLVGVSAGGAVALSVCLGVMAIVMAAPAGILWLVGRKKGEVFSAAEAEAAVEEVLSHSGETPK